MGEAYRVVTGPCRNGALGVARRQCLHNGLFASVIYPCICILFSFFFFLFFSFSFFLSKINYFFTTIKKCLVQQRILMVLVILKLLEIQMLMVFVSLELDHQDDIVVLRVSGESHMAHHVLKKNSLPWWIFKSSIDCK